MPSMDEENDIRRFLVRGTGSQMGANESAKDLLDAIKTVVDSILADTGTTLEAKLDAIDTIVDAILVDTGTTLEGKLDAIEGSGFSTTTDSLKILSDILDLIRTELTFQHQADATLSQANPVQNTWYTILDTTLNVRLINCQVYVATTGETLDMRITIDGNVLTGSIAAVADTNYYVILHAAAESLVLLTDNYIGQRAFLIEGRSVKVEVRKTTAAGTGTLSGRVKYAKR